MDRSRAFEDIAYMRRLMADAKNATHDFGRFYMVWAGAVIVGMVFQLTLIHYGINDMVPSVLIWVVTMGSAMIWDIRETKRIKNARPVATFTTKTLQMIWASCMVGILTSLFIWPFISLGKFTHITTVITLIMGIGHYVTGVISKSPPLMRIGILWLISFIPSAALIEQGDLFSNAVMFAFLMFALQFVPGYFYSRSLKVASTDTPGISHNAESPSAESALKDIHYIKKLINDTRRATLDLGIFYMVWTLLVVFGIMAEIAMYQLDYPHYTLPLWGSIMLGGMLWSVRHFLALRRAGHTTGLSNNLVISTWGVTLITLNIALFLFPAVHGGIYMFSSGTLALLIGLGHYITGELCGSKVLRASGVAWWLYSMVLIHVGALGYWQYLGSMFMLGMVFLQLLPGYIYSRNMKSVVKPA